MHAFSLSNNLNGDPAGTRGSSVSQLICRLLLRCSQAGLLYISAFFFPSPSLPPIQAGWGQDKGIQLQDVYDMSACVHVGYWRGRDDGRFTDSFVIRTASTASTVQHRADQGCKVVASGMVACPLWPSLRGVWRGFLACCHLQAVSHLISILQSLLYVLEDFKKKKEKKDRSIVELPTAIVVIGLNLFKTSLALKKNAYWELNIIQ